MSVSIIKPWRRLAWLAIGSALAGACAAGDAVRPDALRVSDSNEQIAECKVAKDARNPFIVEWPAVERNALKTNSQKGLVAVNYVSCNLKILRACKGKGEYVPIAAAPASETVLIDNQNQLMAELPLGAVKLQSYLDNQAKLRFAYVTAGQQQASGNVEFEGNCGDATHYVRAMTMGAFKLERIARGAIGVGAGVTGVGAAEGGVKSLVEEVKSEGDMEACQGSGEPAHCHAVLQLELEPMPAAVGGAVVATPKPVRDRRANASVTAHAAEPPGIEAVADYIHWPAAALMAAGGAALGVGLWMDRDAAKTRSVAEKDATGVWQIPREDAESANQKIKYRNVFVPVGAAAILGGLAWWIADPPEPRREPGGEIEVKASPDTLTLNYQTGF